MGLRPWGLAIGPSKFCRRRGTDQRDLSSNWSWILASLRNWQPVLALDVHGVLDLRRDDQERYWTRGREGTSKAAAAATESSLPPVAQINLSPVESFRLSGRGAVELADSWFSSSAVCSGDQGGSVALQASGRWINPSCCCGPTKDETARLARFSTAR